MSEITEVLSLFGSSEFQNWKDQNFPATNSTLTNKTINAEPAQETLQEPCEVPGMIKVPVYMFYPDSFLSKKKLLVAYAYLPEWTLDINELYIQ